MKFDASIGIPIPRLAYMPSSNSHAARRTIFSRIFAAADCGFPSSKDKMDKHNERPVDTIDAAGNIEKLREEVHDKDALSKKG